MLNMKKSCTSKELAAGLIAKAIADGGGRFSFKGDANYTGIGGKRTDGFPAHTPEEIAFHEWRMSVEDGKKSLSDEMKAEKHKKKEPYPGLLEYMNNQEALGESGFGLISKLASSVIAPNTRVPSRVFSALHNELQKFTADTASLGRDEAKNRYQETVAPKADRWLAYFENAVNEVPQGGKDMTAYLQKDGLDMKASDLYDTVNWLRWLSDGGLYFNKNFKSDKWNPLVKSLDNFSAGVMRMNIKWSVSNVAELYRVGAFYKPGAVLRGVREALKATNGNLFSEAPELKAQGVYDTQWARENNVSEGDGVLQKIDAAVGKALSKTDKFDVFRATVNMQKNIAWYVDKAAGGDGWTGQRKAVLDRPWWDMPMMYSDHRLKNTLSMTRYLYSETAQYLALIKNAKEKPMDLINYTVMRAVVFGVPAVIPAPVWEIMKKGMEEEELEELKGTLNAINPVAPFKAMQEYVQPLPGLYVGATLSKAGGAIGEVGKGAVSAPVALFKGDVGEFALYSMTTAANLGMFAYGVPESLVNTLEAGRDILIEDMSQDEAAQKALEKQFGQKLGKNIKKQLTMPADEWAEFE